MKLLSDTSTGGAFMTSFAISAQLRAGSRGIFLAADAMSRHGKAIFGSAC
jgi:hypothetical protein